MCFDDSDTERLQKLAAGFSKFLTDLTVKVLAELSILPLGYGFDCRSGPYVLNALVDLPGFAERLPNVADLISYHEGDPDTHPTLSDKALWVQVAALTNRGEELDFGEEWPMPLPTGGYDLVRSIFLEAEARMCRAAKERARKESKDGGEEV